MSDIKIKSAFVSVFYKDGLGAIVKKLDSLGVSVVSTGGRMSSLPKQESVPAGLRI